jgi:Ca2+-binding RTX toxin-like protein
VGIDQMDGGAGNDTLIGGDGDDLQLGSAGNDIVDGGAGNDFMLGDEGDDTLIGGTGDDIMEGGLGNDVFVFGPAFGNDTIFDFDADPAGGQDRLNVAAFNLNLVTFGSRVTITGDGVDTLVTVNGADGGSITLVGVADPTTVTVADFVLA